LSGPTTPSPGQTFDTIVSDLSVAGATEVTGVPSHTMPGMVVVSPTPEIDLMRGTTAIVSGGTDAVAGAVIAQPSLLAYTVFNCGAAALTVGVPALSALLNCRAFVATRPPPSIAALGRPAMQIVVTPSSVGPFSCSVSMANEDPNENPCLWTISRNATLPPVPEMDVLRASTPIADGGGDAPGNVACGVAQVVTYTIANSGTGGLNLTGTPDLVVVTPGATLLYAAATLQPASSVAAGYATTFAIACLVVSPGAFSFAVSIDNDDANENPYNWTVSGTGVVAAPEMDVSFATAALADGGAYNWGPLPPAIAASLPYTITNSGSATLNLSGVNILSQSNCVVTVAAMPAAAVAPSSATSLAGR
jgi:hypothetical protein